MQKSKEIERSILENTRVLLQQMSFEEFNMRLLAQHCGVAVGTLYNYYPTKQDLLKTIIAQHSAMLIGRIDAAIASKSSTLAQLMAVFDLLYTAYNQNHTLWISRMEHFLQDEANGELRKSSRMIHSEIISTIFERVRNILKQDDRQNAQTNAQPDTHANALADALGRLLLSYCLIPCDSREEVEAVFVSILSKTGV